MKSKRKTRFKGIVSFLMVITLASSFIPIVTAGVPASDVIYSVTDLKVTSSPVEEENNFSVQATYHAKITNYGWDSSVWHQCGGCGGAGAVPRYAMGVGGGKVGEVTLVCGQSFEGRTWKCREACDGNDYFDQYDNKGEVTHNTENPWDGESSNNWDDGGTHIWDKSSAIPCVCTMKVQIGDKPANSGMVPCRGCEGKGTIYKGLADCSSCDSTNQKDCNNCGGTGSIKIFETCAECMGAGQVTEFVPCPQCGGSGGMYVTVHHDPVEPSNQVSTEVTIGIDGVIQDTKNIMFDLTTTQQNGFVWTKEGDVTVDWVINAGEGIGDKKVETTIDGGDEPDERKEIIVKVEPACNLTVDFVTPNSNYRTGTEVISTFVVRNHNSKYGLDIKPKHKLTASFVAKDKASGKVLATKNQGDIVIPKGVSNIVYFKWLVPADYSGGDVVVECKINNTYVKNKAGVNEDNMGDNIATATVKSDKYELMETEDTQFEERAPLWFRLPSASDTVDTTKFATSVISQASFEQWEWNGTAYKLAKYELKLDAKTKLTPDVNSPSHKATGDSFTMKSGYGVSNIVNAKTLPGSAPANSYTIPQSATFHIPEYRYVSLTNKFRTLERTSSGVFEFHKNKFAKNDKGVSDNRRIHFTPLYYPDGEYTGKTFVFDVWTPVGMLSKIADSTVTINGDMYDDWYISHTKPKR